MEKITDIHTETVNDIRKLKKHFRKIGECVLIEGNNPLGVNEITAFLGKSSVDIIGCTLKSPKYPLTVINMDNLFMNKTRHLYSSLIGNITIHENQLIRYFSNQTAVKKLFEDATLVLDETFNGFNKNITERENKDLILPSLLSNVVSITKPCYKKTSKLAEKGITDIIQDAKEPHFILTSGCNDLMFRIRNNPMSIERDSKKRHRKGNYFLTRKLIKENDIVKETIDGVRNTILLLKQINPRIQIYLPNLIIPTNLKSTNRKMFRELIEEYNRELLALSRETNCSYIDQTSTEKKDTWTRLFVNKQNEKSFTNLMLHTMCERIVEKPLVLSKTKTNFAKTNLGISEIEKQENLFYKRVLDSTIQIDREKTMYGNPDLLEEAANSEKRKVLKELHRGIIVCQKVRSSK